jgi:hypothetical protein
LDGRVTLTLDGDDEDEGPVEEEVDVVGVVEATFVAVVGVEEPEVGADVTVVALETPDPVPELPEVGLDELGTV